MSANYRFPRIPDTPFYDDLFFTRQHKISTRCYVQESPPCKKNCGTFFHVSAHVQEILLRWKKPMSSYISCSIIFVATGLWTLVLLFKYLNVIYYDKDVRRNLQMYKHTQFYFLNVTINNLKHILNTWIITWYVFGIQRGNG